MVIVGAGPGGLANAMLLAKAGCKVTVLERKDRVGGRTSTFGADGFKFDVGPTFFLYPRVLREIFQMCGRSLDAEVDLVRLDPHYRLLYGSSGDHLDVTPDVEGLEREIGRLAPIDARNVRAYMQDNREKLAAFRPILESAFDGPRALLKQPLMKLLPMVRPWASVDTDLKRFFADPRVRLAFTFQSKYIGMSPFNCPSLFTILSFLEYEYGVFHPLGGCGAVSEAMARVARDLGVEIKLDEPVEKIHFDGRRAVGVETPRGRYACDALSINADFARAMERLVPDRLRRRWTNKKLAKKKYSCSTFMMYLGLDGEVDLPHHTIYLSDSYEENLADIEKRHCLSADPSFYVQNACVTDPGMAPKGQSSLYVLVPVTHEHPNVDWSTEAAPFRRRVLRQLERVGIEDAASRTRFEKVMTPTGWSEELEIYKGATFNLAHSLDQMLHLRPRNRFDELDGVYLVGGGTHPGSGLPVIFGSAQITSRLMAEDLRLEPSWESIDEGSSPLPLSEEWAQAG